MILGAFRFSQTMSCHFKGLELLNFKFVNVEARILDNQLVQSLWITHKRIFTNLFIYSRTMTDYMLSENKTKNQSPEVQLTTCNIIQRKAIVRSTARKTHCPQLDSGAKKLEVPINIQVSITYYNLDKISKIVQKGPNDMILQRTISNRI